MNAPFLANYKKLSKEQKASLLLNYENSPILKRVIQFLDKQSGTDFSNHSVVYQVYEEESEKRKIPYSILENRYYKLRKRIQEDIEKLNSTSTQSLLTSDETYLFEIIRTDKYDFAWTDQAEKLDKIENNYWKHNSFEILQQIIDIRIQKNTDLGIPTTLELVKKQKLLFDLITDLNRIKTSIRNLEVISEGFLGGEPVLEFLQQANYISKKRKEFPRFNYIYHFCSAKYKIDSVKKISSQIIKKHLQVCKSILVKTPELPLLYNFYNNSERNRLYILELEIIYERNRGNYEAIESLIESVIRPNILQTPSFIQLIEYRLRFFYTNIIHAKMELKKHKEAWDYSDLFYSYLQKYKLSKSRILAFVYKAQIILNSFPQTPVKQFDFVINFLLDWSKEQKNKSTVRYNNVQVLLAKLFIINKDLKRAQHQLNHPACLKFIQTYLKSNFYESLIKQILKPNSSLSNEFEKELYQTMSKEKDIVIQGEYDWIYKVYLHFTKK